MNFRNLVIGLLVGLAFTGAGGFIIFNHYQTTMHSTPVEGVVVESFVADLEGDPSTGEPGGSRPYVEYRYTYKGTTYTSSKLCPGEYNVGCYGPETEKVAQSVVDHYPERANVTVHVDPDDPSNAYLIEGNPGIVGRIVVGGIPLVYFVPVGMGLLAIVGTAGRFVKQLSGGRNERRGGSDVSDGAGQSDGMAHPIVPVVLGILTSAGGAYSVWVGAVLAGVLFVVLGLIVLYIGVRRLVLE